MTTGPRDELDGLIRAVAEHGDARSWAALVDRLGPTEVFYPAEVARTRGGQRVSVPLLRLEDGTHAMVVYTNNSHPDLPQRFGGAPWRHAVELATQLPDADWMIVRGSDGGWLPIHRRRFPELLTALGVRPAPDEEVDPEPLETLISGAAGDSARPVVDALLHRLRSQELFVAIAPKAGPNGEPLFVTSAAGDLDKLLQVYTTRRRAGMAYAGMTWDGIAGVVTHNPDIRGVQVINDADDWVVFGRADV